MLLFMPLPRPSLPSRRVASTSRIGTLALEVLPCDRGPTGGSTRRRVGAQHNMMDRGVTHSHRICGGDTGVWGVSHLHQQHRGQADGEALHALAEGGGRVRARLGG